MIENHNTVIQEIDRGNVQHKLIKIKRIRDFHVYFRIASI